MSERRRSLFTQNELSVAGRRARTLVAWRRGHSTIARWIVWRAGGEAGIEMRDIATEGVRMV
jgi:hypothetical protein